MATGESSGAVYIVNNQVADILTKEGSKLDMTNSFLLWVVLPLFVVGKLEADKVRTPFPRHSGVAILMSGCPIEHPSSKNYTIYTSKMINKVAK